MTRKAVRSNYYDKHQIRAQVAQARYLARNPRKQNTEIQRTSEVDSVLDLAFMYTQHRIEHSGSSIQNPWVITLLLVAALIPLATATSSFPNEGSYQEQKAYVDSLPSGCSPSALSVLNRIDHQSPLAVSPEVIPKNVHYKAWKHTFFPEDGVATKRLKEISNENHIDITEIFIGSEQGKGKGFLHRFRLKPDGDLEPLGKKPQSMEAYAQGLSASSAVVTEITTDDNRCYQHKRV